MQAQAPGNRARRRNKRSESGQAQDLCQSKPDDIPLLEPPCSPFPYPLNRNKHGLVTSALQRGGVQAEWAAEDSPQRWL